MTSSSIVDSVRSAISTSVSSYRLMPQPPAPHRPHPICMCGFLLQDCVQCNSYFSQMMNHSPASLSAGKTSGNFVQQQYNDGHDDDHVHDYHNYHNRHPVLRFSGSSIEDCFCSEPSCTFSAKHDSSSVITSAVPTTTKTTLSPNKTSGKNIVLARHPLCICGLDASQCVSCSRVNGIGRRTHTEAKIASRL
ncbi:uncharacterized protein SAPINGB_P000555 [Magnusiomyces paraingens]|uniref:Uncharacterized protein n=1 Tax=Magnusiomyces paraingens TaxID=2606893 RepID=A0A5E8B7P1_9ASCO|nr:uncharacterized protein SAPINGB_P000555 [Saprochaete ingens]VVT44851.1 unnamed protein product [Saprochaete ingens]